MRGSSVERGVGLADVGVDPLKLRFPLGPLLVEFSERVTDRVADDLFLSEQGLEAFEDRLVELLGGEAVGGAVLGA